MKGLKLSIPPKKLNYAEYLVGFELFYRSIYNIESMPNENLVFVKTKIKDAYLTSFHNYNINIPCNLLDKEFEVLQNLSENTNLEMKKSNIRCFVISVSIQQ